MAIGMVYGDNTAKRFLPDLVVVNNMETFDFMLSLGMRPSQLRLRSEL